MFTQEQKIQLKQSIRSNQHEIFIVSFEEFDSILSSYSQVSDVVLHKGWEKLRDKAGFAANYTANFNDTVLMSKLIADLGSSGAKVYIKSYGGKAHLIIKGRAGLRQVLTGTKYGINNPKVVAMGLGRAGAINAAKTGGILSIVLLTTYRVVDYFLSDKMTLTQLVGTLATDIIKVGIATGASIAAAAAFGSVTLAIGPIVAVIIVGVIFSAGLGFIDEQFGITDKVIAGLEVVSDNLERFVRVSQMRINKVKEDVTESILEAAFDYVAETTRRLTIRFVKGVIRKYSSPYNTGFASSASSRLF